MKKYAFLAFYEDIGHYMEGRDEGEAHSFGIFTYEKPTLEQWLRFTTLVRHTSLSRNMLSEIHRVKSYIRNAMKDDRKFYTKDAVFDCENGEMPDDLFSDNISYLKVVGIGEIKCKRDNVMGLKKMVISGPVSLDIPPRMEVYEFKIKRDSRIGDRADEIFANTQEMMRIASLS